MATASNTGTVAALLPPPPKDRSARYDFRDAPAVFVYLEKNTDLVEGLLDPPAGGVPLAPDAALLGLSRIRADRWSVAFTECGGWLNLDLEFV